MFVITIWKTYRLICYDVILQLPSHLLLLVLFIWFISILLLLFLRKKFFAWNILAFLILLFIIKRKKESLLFYFSSIYLFKLYNIFSFVIQWWIHSLFLESSPFIFSLVFELVNANRKLLLFQLETKQKDEI
jgi:hypothetical protein